MQHAYVDAVMLGETEVAQVKHLKEVIKNLLEAKQVVYYSSIAKNQLLELEQHTPKEGDPDASLGVYFTCNKEDRLQDALRDFLAARKFKCGHFRNKIKATRKWLETTKDEDKVDYKQFDNIFSGEEVATVIHNSKKRSKPARGKLGVLECAIRASQKPVNNTRKQQLNQHFKTERHLASLHTAMARWRKSHIKHPTEKNFSAVDALHVSFDSTHPKGGPTYSWQIPTASDNHELLLMLFPKIVDPKRGILSIDGVDTTKGAGKKLTKAVKNALDALATFKADNTRRKGQQLLTLQAH